jgi:hypothetical protein
LISDITHVSEMANIPIKFITHSMKEFCPQEDMDFVRHHRKLKAEGKSGLLMVGESNAETRMMAMCGAFIRNFIDARVIPVNTLLAAQESGDVPNPSVLLIPNLYLDLFGKSLPAWKVQALYDLILSRFVAGKVTIFYAENMSGLEKAYGRMFADHLNNNYQLMEAK